MRRTLCLTLLFIIGISVLASPVAYAQGSDVLLVCSTDEQSAFLSDLIEACGKTVDVVMNGDYSAGQAASYKYVVTTTEAPLKDANRPVCVGGEFSSSKTTQLVKVESTRITIELDGFTQPSRFEKSAVLIGQYKGTAYGSVVTAKGSVPFAVFADDRVSVPYVAKDDLSAVALGGVLQKYFGNSGSGSMYVLVDNIYAFSDLSMLCKLADALHENGIPFILRITPMYENLDYPAFKRYAQVLRYAQSRNGTVILGEPIVIENEMEKEPLADKMQRFHNALEEQRIEWVSADSAPYVLTLDALTQVKSGTKNFGSFPLNTMISVPLPADEQELSEMVQRLNAKWLSVSDYRRKFTSESYIYNEQPVDDDYVYVHGEKLQFESFFSAGNSLLLGVVSVSLVIFTGLIIVGYRLYKRKFTRRTPL